MNLAACLLLLTIAACDPALEPYLPEAAITPLAHLQMVEEVIIWDRSDGLARYDPRVIFVPRQMRPGILAHEVGHVVGWQTNLLSDWRDHFWEGRHLRPEQGAACVDPRQWSAHRVPEDFAWAYAIALWPGGVADERCPERAAWMREHVLSATHGLPPGP